MGRLESIGPDIWLCDGPVVDFFGFPYSTRMIIIRLESGALWVWSPIALDAALEAEVRTLGEPGYLVSPNKLHHLYLGAWQKAFPLAQLWGLPSVIAKRGDLEFDGILKEAPPPEWRDAIDQVVFSGSPFMDECVFFHRPSRTAIFADLSENFSQEVLAHDPRWSWWKRAIARVWRITEPFGMAPLEWRLSFFNRGRAKAALDKIERWQAEQVVMAHGQWIPNGGARFISQSFRWLRPPERPATHN